MITWWPSNKDGSIDGPVLEITCFNKSLILLSLINIAFLKTVTVAASVCYGHISSNLYFPYTERLKTIWSFVSFGRNNHLGKKSKLRWCLWKHRLYVVQHSLMKFYHMFLAHLMMFFLATLGFLVSVLSVYYFWCWLKVCLVNKFQLTLSINWPTRMYLFSFIFCLF